VVTLLVIQQNPKGIGFTVLHIVRKLLKPVMLDSLKMVKSVGVIKPQNVVIQDVRVQVPLPKTSKENVVPTVVQSFDNVEQVIDQSLHDEIITNESIIEESQGIALMRSQRERRFAIQMIMWFI